MPNALIYFLAFFIGLFFSLIFTPLVKKIAFKFKILDYPNARKIHEFPIPRWGGLALYLSSLISISITLFLGTKFFLFKKEFLTFKSFYFLKGLFLGTTLMLILGMIDDWKNIPPKIKFFFQILIALILYHFHISIDFITYPFGEIVLLPKILSFLLTLFWIVGITNAVNLLDGLDGLLAGITVISALTFGGVAVLKHQFLAAILMLVLGGAALGFLPFNFYPAKIFLGDAGSLFIGVILAVLTIMGAFKTTATLALFIPILIMGIPIFDTAYAIIRRFLTKKPIFKADREHIHHNLLNLGLTQRQVVCIIYLINFILGMVGLILAYYF